MILRGFKSNNINHSVTVEIQKIKLKTAIVDMKIAREALTLYNKSDITNNEKYLINNVNFLIYKTTDLSFLFCLP